MKTILIADDEFELLEALQMVLEGEGYRVRTAEDGQAALESAVAEPPDLVLMDVMMPRLGGLEALASLRQNKALARVPVVLMSAVDLAGRDAPQQATAFLLKPFTLDRLLATVRRVFRSAA